MASKMGKRFTGVFSRSKNATSSSSAENGYNFNNAPIGSPEGDVGNSIRLFCESGSASNGGEEVLHLPVIVEAAESSPSAAAAAAQQIRIFLSREWASKPHVQYNAVMLIRILSDNPGPSFTRNFDKAFVSTVKETLKTCKDVATQQILRETLDTLEANKQFQDGMEGLIQMWRKEKGQNASFPNYASRGRLAQGAPNDFVYQHQATGMVQRPGQGERSHSGRHRQLPPPVELASRIEEARNTAKILLQLIQSTPSEELLHNELIREFSDRCQSAQKSMAGYIACDNPPPDDETMLTLIETNEQLSLATSRYQRSLLNARKALGLTSSPNAEAMMSSALPAATPPAAPPTGQEQNLFARSGSPPRTLPQSVANTSAFTNANEEFRAPPGPPPQQSTQQRSLPNDSDSFVPPPGPPPPRQSTQSSNFSQNSGAFSSPLGPPPRRTTQPRAPTNQSGSYSPPPSPPTAMLARLNSRDGQTSPTRFEPRQPQPVSDPFADPVEHESNPPALAYETPANRPHPSAFGVDSGPTFAPGNIQPSPIDHDDPYRTSPVQSRAGLPDEPVSPITPSQKRWQDLRNTASYMGWRTSAAENLTVHGAQPAQDVPEIDGHSEVGRTEQPAIGRNNTGQSDAASSAYSASPTRTHV